MAKYGYGVDVGGTSVKIGRFSDDGKLLEKWDIRTDNVEDGGNILKEIAASVMENIEKNGLKKEEILGIGMGVPGPVDDTGLITCVNLGWKKVPAVKIMSELTGLTVKCTNDANAAALGEMWAGSGKGCSNMVMITLGTGVGGGVIVDGKIYNGVHGSAGELGHLPINPDETRPCNCGNYGCLEQYASANGNVRIAEDYLKECDTPSPLRSAERINSKLCWDLAIEGDPVAVEIANRFSNYLGMGLAMIATILDPGAIVIGGGVSRTGEPLRAMVEKYYKKYAFHACRDTELRLATLGNDAGMYGCMYMLMS